MTSRLFGRFIVVLIFVNCGAILRAEEEAPPTFGGDLWNRSKLTGDWGGTRDAWAARGFTIDFDITYTFQGVVDGGIPNTGDTVGNTVSADLVFGLDTTKAKLWPGGIFKVRLEGRAGDSVFSRTGTVSPVSVDALFPVNPNEVDDAVWGLTELTYMQFLSPKFALIGGLLNALDADDNPIAGNARRNATFLNTAFLVSPVESTGAPSVALGGGALLIPTHNIHGTFTVVGSEETATHNPFQNYNGTTFATEWTIKHELFGHPGGQVFGAIYSINKSRTDIAQNPRVFIADVLLNRPTPTTDKDTWAFYYNVHQYIQGDQKHGGWGPFVRFGFSDGDPNPIRWNIASGVAGTGLIPGRVHDAWGAGIYYLALTDNGLLSRLDIDDELGGEVFYNIAITPAAHVTLDAQVVDSARPRQDTVVVLGVRLRLDF